MRELEPSRRDAAKAEGLEGRALDLPESGSIEKLVLSRGNLFFVTNPRGDVTPPGARDLGLFREDTRHLSALELRCGGSGLILLSGEVISSALAQMDFTLTDREYGGLVDDPQNFLHLRRKHLLDEDELLVQLSLTNHLRHPMTIWADLLVDADFADIFEVRGARRTERGTHLPPEIAGNELTYSYRGRDHLLYRTTCAFTPDPRRLVAGRASFELALEPGEAVSVECLVTLARGTSIASRPARPMDVRLASARAEVRAFADGATRFGVSDRPLQAALDRAVEDLAALRIRHDGRWILGAGIPWFAAPFGRDSIITSLQTLPLTHELARETLRALASYQGTQDDPERDEEPGKIMHELRRGEMARTREIPHSPYYGSVDATPLFVVLLGELHRWSGDHRFLDEIWPAVLRALSWIDSGTQGGTDLLRYQRRGPKGLVNQGWKDSRDAVSFPDGSLADTPIALVEVQGYVVDAYQTAGDLARRRGDETLSGQLAAKAASMRARIEERFWMPAAGYYALAVDGHDRQVPTISSNPGHLLFSRAISPPRALRVAEVLLSPMMYSGFGVRTVGRGQAVYNPLSYHNGSVWPHDSAMCALGMARFGLVAGTLTILDGLRSAAVHFRGQRLPELFCGMARGEGDVLVQYPVSCSPQAWAAGTFFMLLQGALGLWPRAEERQLLIRNPHLPEWLHNVELDGLHVGRTEVSLRFQQADRRCHVDVLDLSGGPLRVQIELD